MYRAKPAFFNEINEVYKKYFPKNPPARATARMSVCSPSAAMAATVSRPDAAAIGSSAACGKGP